MGSKLGRHLVVAGILVYLTACSVVHITTPFFSTISEPIFPRETDHDFLDRVKASAQEAGADVSSEVARVREEMVAQEEDRYWAAQQLLASDAVDDGLHDRVIEALVLTDEDYQSPYVSAKVCGQCHPKHYDEWSVSPHAYAQMSPVFNAMHGTIVKLTNGTFGDFCIRCHTPVGMNIQEPSFMANESRYITSREGVTCVVCHRVDADFGKISGRMPFVVPEDGIFGPVFGPEGDDVLQAAIESDDFRLKPSADEGSGQRVHATVEELPELTEPGFCGMCHDVTLGNTFRLEEAFSEYKSSPAATRGATCQDCHMGKVPGRDEGYDYGPAAVVGPQETPPRRLTNHMMAGPDYSIVHPGLFPHLPQKYGNPDDQHAYPFFAELTPGRYKFTQERSEDQEPEFERIPLWLDFDYRGDWGKPEFEEEHMVAVGDLYYAQDDYAFAMDEDRTEDAAAAKATFDELVGTLPDFASWGPSAPSIEDLEWSAEYEHWKDKRVAARQILEGRQYRLLAEYRRQQIEVLRAGYEIEEVDVRSAGAGGIDIAVAVKNGTDGHNVPTGFIAERSVFLQVWITDADGETVLASGDLDPNGDIRDLHSVFVHDAEPGTKEPLWWMPLEEPEEEPVDPWRAPTGHVTPSDEAMGLDPFLFSLQSKFIVRLNRGGEREQVLAVNHSPDPLPFLRPPARSNILVGRPRGARTHRKSIPPLARKWATYAVGAGDLEGRPGPYTARIRLVTGMVPVNLVHEIAQVGFDYGMSARDIARGIVNGFEAPVFEPTTVGTRGLVALEDEDWERGPVMKRLNGRQILWEYEVELDGSSSDVRRLIPPEPEGEGDDAEDGASEDGGEDGDADDAAGNGDEGDEGDEGDGD